MSNLRWGVVVLALVGGVMPATSAQAAPARQAAKQAAIVTIGDSWVSGEGAGSYVPATDTKDNLCHRSLVAQVQMTAIPGLEKKINLACSGAGTVNIKLGGSARYGEAPQAEQLRAVAKEYDVRLVVVTAGAVDLGFSGLALDCVKAYFRLSPRCQDVWKSKVPSTLAKVGPALDQVLKDIRAVMGGATYDLVVQSYASPVTGDMKYSFTKILHGCPFRDDDAKWAKEVVTPMLTATMYKSAAAANARFLNLQPAFDGREVCARDSRSQEWIRRVGISLPQLRTGVGSNLIQQSLHPNELGHVQLGRCLSDFVPLRVVHGQCAANKDGNLQAAAMASEPALTEVHTLPDSHDPAPPATVEEARRLEAAGYR